MELSRRNLHDDDLLPLLEGLRVGKFSRLMILNLVIYIYIYMIACNMTKMLLGVTHVLQGGNQIGDRGAEMIGEGLKVNSSLQWLHLVRLVLLI